MDNKDEKKKDSDLKNKKSGQELKAELEAGRQAEIEGYKAELVKFCEDRNIDITATVTVGQGGNNVQIIIIDKL